MVLIRKRERVITRSMSQNSCSIQATISDNFSSLDSQLSSQCKKRRKLRPKSEKQQNQSEVVDLTSPPPLKACMTCGSQSENLQTIEDGILLCILCYEAQHSPSLECVCCNQPLNLDNDNPELAQCTEGCPICVPCIQSYVKMAAFDTANSALTCPNTTECIGRVLPSTAQKCVSAELWLQYTERAQKNSISRSNIKLVVCFHCKFTVELIDEVLFFCCPFCFKKSCTKCHQEYHPQVSCFDVSNEGTQVRTTIEETLSNAKIRYCTNLLCKLVIKLNHSFYLFLLFIFYS
jgi:hypothetical protein